MSMEKSKKAQDLESGSIVKQLGEYLARLWNSFIASLEPEPITFDEFLTETETFLDEQILATQKKEKLVYMGGKLILTLEDSKPSGKKSGVKGLKIDDNSNDDKLRIIATAELYYNDIDEQWVKQAVAREIDKSLFSDWDSSEELHNLRLNKKVEFDITPPEDAAE